LNKTCNCGILGLGSSFPEKVLTNHDLEKMVDTSDEWIIKRTGISERRVLDEDMPTYKLGVEAAKKALADAKVNPEEVDLISDILMIPNEEHITTHRSSGTRTLVN